MHRLVIGAYLNNQDKFEDLCSKARTIENTPSLTQSKISVQGAQSQKHSEKFNVSNGYVLSRLIENFMSPTLVNYSDFHDEFIVAAFEKYVHHLIAEIMNLHFMLSDLSSPPVKKDESADPDEAKKMDEAKLNEKPKEILKTEQDFLALQIHAKFTQYPMPKVN